MAASHCVAVNLSTPPSPVQSLSQLGTLLLLLSAAVPAGGTPPTPHRVTVHEFRNDASQEGLDSLCTLIADGLREYFVAKGVPVVRVAAPADTTLIPEQGRTMVYGSLRSGGEGLVLRAAIRMGIDRMAKELPYDPHVEVERNIQPAIDALFAVYERRHFSNVQVFTAPDSARVWIDGVPVGASPWEARVLQGPHSVRIAKDGFETLEEEVVLSGSDNKLRYALAEIRNESYAEEARMQPQSPPPAVPAPHHGRTPAGRWLALGASIAGTAFGFYAQSQYTHNKDNYDRPALSVSQYDTYARGATAYLYARNASFGVGVCLLGVFALQSLRDGD